MAPDTPFERESVCPDCSHAMEPRSLACGNCGRLARAPELQALSRKAQAAAAAGSLTEARDLWVQVMSLLPPDTLQYKSVATRIAELDKTIAGSPDGQPKPASGLWRRLTSALAPAAFLLWKF